MQFVKEFGIINKTLQDNIKNFVNADKEKFEPSMVYNRKDDKKLIKPEIRKSSFKLLKDKKLFKMFKQLIGKINKKDEFMDFIVWENDITYIKYQEGGYFKKHKDYLSLTSNIVQEYTLIMCLEGGCDGGETILHFNKFFNYPSKSTITPGHILIFRKDIDHEGNIIKKGSKEILTLNLWGVKKNSGIVIIRFNKPEKRTHVISQTNILSKHNNLLKSFLWFGKNGKNENVFYHEKKFTYDQFSIVAKVYNDHTLSYDEYQKAQKILDFYGFDVSKMLLGSLAYKFNTNEINIGKDNKINNNDFILCNNKERYKQMMEIVKNNMLPYIPFRLEYIEGNYVVTSDDSYGNDIDMMCCRACFSERENVMFETYFQESRGNMRLYYPPKLPKSFDFDKTSKSLKGDDLLKYFIKKHVDIDQDDYNFSYNLTAYNKSKFGSLLSPYDLYDQKYTDYCCEYIKKDEVKMKTKWYIIDTKGRLSINPEHYYKAIYDRVNETQLYNSVQKQLESNNVKFNFPQKDEEVNENLCNEQVYGKLNFVEVFGFLKMK